MWRLNSAAQRITLRPSQRPSQRISPSRPLPSPNTPGLRRRQMTGKEHTTGPVIGKRRIIPRLSNLSNVSRLSITRITIFHISLQFARAPSTTIFL